MDACRQALIDLLKMMSENTEDIDLRDQCLALKEQYEQQGYRRDAVELQIERILEAHDRMMDVLSECFEQGTLPISVVKRLCAALKGKARASA